MATVPPQNRRPAKVEQSAPDPESTRAFAPELTRCDYCQVLDSGTQPTLEFNDHPGDGWIWLHDACRPLFQKIAAQRQEDSKGRLVISKGRGGLSMDELMQNPVCAYCGSNIGRVQRIAIGQPGQLEVHECFLHPECERAYRRMIEDPEK